jgi:phosphotransferase system  glucose/maltose/N-acetylglucosamine-specific IIC component
LLLLFINKKNSKTKILKYSFHGTNPSFKAFLNGLDTFIQSHFLFFFLHVPFTAVSSKHGTCIVASALMFVSLTVQLLVYYAPCSQNSPSTLTPTLRENTSPENMTSIIPERPVHLRALEHSERVTDFESGLKRHR